MKKHLFLIFLLSTFVSFAQNSQASYLRAKNEFNASNHEGASLIFASLTEDPVFGSYATFYFGLSKHLSGENETALNAWRQLLTKNPLFEQRQEIHYWMSKVFFDESNYLRGIEEAQKIEDVGLKKQLYAAYLPDLSFNRLRSIFPDYNDDRALATEVIKSAARSDLSQGDEYFLDGLTSRLNISSEDLGDFAEIKKEQYAIAVLLPFLFDGLDKPERIIRNTLIMDLYQGMLLAQKKLDENGMAIELFPYDTRRDSASTKQLLQENEISKLDVIVGPLFPGPLAAAREYAKTNEINLINPVSGNAEGLIDNPYGYILKPDYVTIAQKAAEFMASTTDKNEVKIYFENKPSEKLIAKEYKRAIEELGFEVSEFLPIDNKSARQVLAQFTDQEEVVLELSDEELDRYREEGRLIRDRRKFDASGNMVLNEDGTPQLEYFELVFTADTDSLDHLFAVTKSNVLANNFVGAVESISDTVRLLGLGDWLEFSMLDFKQLERLNVNLIDVEYQDRTSPFFNEIKDAYLSEYKKLPSNFSYLGFESVWWLGNMLTRHGKYFQNGFYSEEDFDSVYYGHQFVPGKNDNQIVPIVQFVDQQLKAINLIDETGEE